MRKNTSVKTFSLIRCSGLTIHIRTTYKCVYSYSLTETELFLHSLLGEEPVKTVVAPETARSNHVRAASKEREMVFTKTIVVHKYLIWLKLYNQLYYRNPLLTSVSQKSVCCKGGTFKDFFFLIQGHCVE